MRTWALQPPEHIDLTAGCEVRDEAAEVVVKLPRLLFIPVLVLQISVEQEAHLLLD